MSSQQSEFTFTYLHPGDYFLTVIADMDADGYPSPGDITHARKHVTVKPKSSQRIEIKKHFCQELIRKLTAFRALCCSWLTSIEPTQETLLARMTRRATLSMIEPRSLEHTDEVVDSSEANTIQATGNSLSAQDMKG